MASANKILRLLMLLSVIQISLASSLENLFENWRKEHGKIYESDEEREYRFRTFADNFAFVTEHNRLGNHSYTLALNAFADLTHHEFRTAYLGFGLGRGKTPVRHGKGSLFAGYGGGEPDAVDWREKGAVTKVKDQGSCGTISEFST